MKELLKIQQELNAPKNLKNNFGWYNYRSAESILEAVKPLLKETECILKLTDELLNIWDRYYVKATVILKNKDWQTEEAVWYAREEETKKWMDGSQITGASSSYARKYALNGLFAIDDEKDSDATNTHWQWEEKTVKKQTENTEEDKPWFNDEQYDQLFDNIDKFKDGDDAVKKARIKYKVSKIMEKKIRDLFFE